MAGHCPCKARAFMSERKTGRDLILSATRKKEGFSFQYYTAEEIENTPSRKDGVSAETEAGYRRNTRAFVQALSNLLKLQAWATQTAIGFCERFYMRRSFKANDRFLVAAAAIFMAAKALDGPRRAIDVAEAFYKTKCAKEPASWDEVKATKGLEIVSNIFTAERALLYTLGFDFQVDLPLNTTARVLAQFNNHVFAKLDKASEGESAGTAPDVEADSPDKLFAQLALNFANDRCEELTGLALETSSQLQIHTSPGVVRRSFKCSLPLQYPMHKIVAGGLAEAAERLNHKLPNPVDKGKEYSFLDYFCMTQAELDDVRAQLCALYTTVSGSIDASGSAAAAPHSATSSVSQQGVRAQPSPIAVQTPPQRSTLPMTSSH
ncbi:uncharacterized protein HaLaN_14360, partial [Haematococcus lacustris]